jgi:hypothetical protein
VAGRAAAPTDQRLVARGSGSSTTPAPGCPHIGSDPPVPIVARIMWADDGEEYIETVAAGWSGQLVYVRLPDRRYRLTSVWLNAADVRRR